MRNISKKTRKKVMRIIKANCDSNDGYCWVPFESSRMAAIWHLIVTDDYYGWNSEISGVFENPADPFWQCRHIEIKSPQQLTNPRLPIAANKLVVKRWEEGGFI